MDEYSGRLLAERYRLPRPPSDEYELVESRAYDTASGQEVLVRQVPLPEVVEAEFLGGGGYGHDRAGRATRRPADPAVRRAVEAALAASRIPDHPRLDQVFDVFVEGDGLWIVSELVAARPLAALLAERPLSPHRAAELAADLLTALRAVHAHGWVHRNITPRTVLVCDDGRAVLTGLAAGAAEEALCGYDPLPAPPSVLPRGHVDGPADGPADDVPESGVPGLPPGYRGADRGPAAGGVPRQLAGPGADEGPEAGEYGADGHHMPHGSGERPEPGGPAAGRAARSGAIAAYRAGTRAAAARAEVEARRGEAGRQAGDLRPVPPGGSAPYGGEAYGEAYGEEPHGERTPPARSWGEEDGDRYRGPTTALAAERARQTRMAIVGAVTERWAPEQAGPVYENWRLAPPVGPAADLWGLGALLFRAVQGHAPYPEESVAELVQMVCAEPPAFAEECGALRPVVESLLRQDPTERPDFEELGGWLRSLIRSAPEPEVGLHTVTAPLSLEAGRPADPRRLPIIRRRGELVRRKRAERSPVATHARHRRARKQRSPRRLGMVLVGLILLLLTGTLVYAAVYMPGGGAGSSGNSADQRPGSVGAQPEQPEQPGEPGEQDPPPEDEAGGPDGPGGSEEPGTERPQAGDPVEGLDGYELHEDASGFRIALPEDARRAGPDGRGRTVFTHGGLEIVVVPGRDTTEEYGSDPMAYLTDDQRELDAYRASDWATSSGMRRIQVGRTVMAEGRFSWRDGADSTYMCDRAVVLEGRYHSVLVRGPESRKDDIDRVFDTIADTYRATG
ncbi:serine/threonine protein kinase [Streptomyces chitinivorans]|uniref:serine/threonine protein kinase n=1 Tax=Streptomyces chitinivorans TaxID=1257027 RepID=UPI002446A239|nr:serine/threonine protein kinase [Streptomyces chitinivorans]MDH2407463.1 serine/threonine protein kinase [Streptomyces chitinivorans]